MSAADSLREAQSSDTVQRNVSQNPVTELREIVACMRELHVSEYQGIKLLPLPSEAPAADDEQTQRQPTAEEERAKRMNVRRIAMASSGGPVPGPRANDRST